MATTSFTNNIVIKKSQGKLLASVFSAPKNITRVEKNENSYPSSEYFKLFKDKKTKN